MASTHLVEFPGPLGTLRGVLHRPDTSAPAPAIMLLHGFSGQHIEDHRLFVQMAHHLTAAGFAALRFDFYGSGDSDGTFEEFTALTEVADALAALDWLEAQPGIDARRTDVIGLSLGGCVTALLAGQDPRPKAIVLWNAVGKPELHFLDLPMTGPDAGVIGGLRVGADFMRTFMALDIPGTLRRYGGPGLVIQATADEAVFMEEAEVLAEALGNRGELHRIEGADHTFRHPSWRTTVFELTTRWLATQLQLHS